MERISQAERAVTEVSLGFIFAIGARCDDKTIIAPIIKGIVEGAPQDERKALSNAYTQTKVAMMLLGDDQEAMLQSLLPHADDRRAVRLVAESFASAASSTMPVAVLKMAMPASARNHRTRQMLRRKHCPKLADLCSGITTGELRIG